TVPRLYDFVRPGSRFERSLNVLREAKRLDPEIVTKSGFMLGLGERRGEVIEVMQRLLETRCEILTIGQYLQPKREKLDVVEYVHPSVFDDYREIGERRGFFRFLVRERHLKYDPTENLDNPKLWTTLPQSLQPVEVDALLAAPDRTKPDGLRDAAMLELLYATGLRVSELIRVKVEDIEL